MFELKLTGASLGGSLDRSSDDLMEYVRSVSRWLLTKMEGEFDFGNVRTLVVGNSPSEDFNEL
ncbi:MAG: hypothetical protein ACTS42_02015 [Candidatus Hodgkinia cicadicola]